jgi:hypothetical protein
MSKGKLPCHGREGEDSPRKGIISKSICSVRVSRSLNVDEPRSTRGNLQGVKKGGRKNEALTGGEGRTVPPKVGSNNSWPCATKVTGGRVDKIV